jgi:hypothetical protein
MLRFLRYLQDDPKFRHEIGQRKKPSMLDNEFEKTNPAKEGFHEQVYPAW